MAEEIDAFEATASVANTGTGTRREGEHFETLVYSWWDALVQHAAAAGVASHAVSTHAGTFVRLSIADRALYLPCQHPRPEPIDPGRNRWFGTRFVVSDLVASYPGHAESISRYAPQTGPFAREAYPAMFSGMTTNFDGTLVLERAGVLHRKILLEYKTCKSSAGVQIDGNAHERLSFQVMQYLEIAPRFTRCEFMVITNGAYTRYRNKYHVNFKVQADRLAAFSWFSMQFISTQPELLAAAERLLWWLQDGSEGLAT